MSYRLDYEVNLEVKTDTLEHESQITFSSYTHISAEYPQTWWTNVSAEQALLRGSQYQLAKRGTDLLLAAVSFPVWLMIIGICGLLIKLESPGGPVFFKQLRTGKDGNRFQMVKFRTMIPGAEEMKQELMHLNELQWPDFKITTDPRITRVGRWLRKTSLDELPQLINVWRGEMSFVGPRPTSFAAETYELWQTERLDVLPGITGLWQVIGRGSMEFDERVRLDIAYIDRQCLRLDFLILLHTVTAVLTQRGAY
ncbi:MAG: sugar transferase [Chloroflexi bacterium]|nr:sugar transferase [Chloroflexota bacterium]